MPLTCEAHHCATHTHIYVLIDLEHSRVVVLFLCMIIAVCQTAMTIHHSIICVQCHVRCIGHRCSSSLLAFLHKCLRTSDFVDVGVSGGTDGLYCTVLSGHQATGHIYTLPIPIFLPYIPCLPAFMLAACLLFYLIYVGCCKKLVRYCCDSIYKKSRHADMSIHASNVRMYSHPSSSR
jgi:hypothetical protein